MRKTFLLMIVCSALVAACAAPADGGGSGTSLAGTTWRLASYGPVSATQTAAQDVDTSLAFGSDGKVSGNMGCNGFSGDYTQADNTLTFGPIMRTLMACEGQRMEQEDAAMQVLMDTATFTLDGDTLTIFSADGSMLLELTRA
jgi:heat shock protein HslJ